MYRCSQVEEFNGKTASEYKQFDCLGTYDTLSEIGKRRREFACRGAAVKLRLILLRTCTCGVMSHLYRNKLDVTERRAGVQGSKTPVGGLGASPLPGLSGGFSAAHRGTINCNFTAAPQTGEEHFLCLFQIKIVISVK